MHYFFLFTDDVLGCRVKKQTLSTTDFSVKKTDAIRALVRSEGSIGMLVMHDRVVTLRPFPPDVEEEAAALQDLTHDDRHKEIHSDLSDRDENGEEADDKETWEEGLRPFQARPFMSEVVERDSGEVSVVLLAFLLFKKVFPHPSNRWRRKKKKKKS